MLIASQALRPLLADLAACAEQAARLAREHRDTRMIGRTLLRQAVPTTFGLKAAGWLSGLDAARWRLEQVRRERLAVQFGGAAGTLAPFGDDGPDVVEGLATLLGLAEPVLPWHTERTRVAELAGALGAAAGIVAKVARDLTLMAQDEVDEASDSTPGGSSAMPHKRNPIAAVCALGSAGSAPGLVASLLAAMAHEHERAAGAWHAEWRPLRELLVCTGSAAAWLRAALERLLVTPTSCAPTSPAQAPGPTSLPTPLVYWWTAHCRRTRKAPDEPVSGSGPRFCPVARTRARRHQRLQRRPARADPDRGRRRHRVTRAAARRFLLTLSELGYVRSDGRQFSLPHGSWSSDMPTCRACHCPPSPNPTWSPSSPR